MGFGCLHGLRGLPLATLDAFQKRSVIGHERGQNEPAYADNCLFY
jgi:hypothetical protein